MKIIVSHDVDHLDASEHAGDGIRLKFAVRTLLEVAAGRTGIPEAARRAGSLRRGRWHRIPEVMDHDERNGIPSTFFFGMAEGLGLSYSPEAAEPWIRQAMSRGFGTGVHGIAYDDPGAIREERDRFRAVSGLEGFGIRMHYLRNSPDTAVLLASAGYAFDATLGRTGNPRIVAGMPVFPVHLMDGWVLQSGPFGMQAGDRERVRRDTRDTIRREAESGTEYFSLLFHDRYYSDEFPAWKSWYEETIEYLRSEGHTFTGYDRARSEVLGRASAV